MENIKTLTDVEKILQSKKIDYCRKFKSNISLARCIKGKLSIFVISNDVLNKDKIYASLNGFKKNFAYETNVSLAIEIFLTDTKEFEQLNLVKDIFAGLKLDKDGYCGCPKCGSRNLLHDGYAIDDGDISCLNCSYSISGSDPYEMISRWNSKNRKSFQLKIPF
ncbi:MAG: hypothetical protein WA101_03400 [Minisyncoccia bacterium]